jgi:hypothetical protein
MSIMSLLNKKAPFVFQDEGGSWCHLGSPVHVEPASNAR